MILAEDWEALQTQLPDGSEGRMRRRIRPESTIDLYIWVQGKEPTRGFELRVDSDAASVEMPPETSGVAMRRRQAEDGSTTLSLELTDSTGTELFGAICSDMAAVLAPCDDASQAASLFVNRFMRWTRLLQRVPRGLSKNRQMGLFAELWVLSEIYVPNVGEDTAVSAWLGPDQAARDFELAGCAVEVKANATNQPQLVKINGERQLDASQLRELYLAHLSLEILPGDGATLPDIVQSLRAQISGLPCDTVFSDKLLDAGYSDYHSDLYTGSGYAVRAVSIFEVRSGFPRIIESDLVNGVGDVHYKLAIDACRQFQVDLTRLNTALRARHG